MLGDLCNLLYYTPDNIIYGYSRCNVTVPPLSCSYRPCTALNVNVNMYVYVNVNVYVETHRFMAALCIQPQNKQNITEQLIILRQSVPSSRFQSRRTLHRCMRRTYLHILIGKCELLLLLHRVNRTLKAIYSWAAFAKMDARCEDQTSDVGLSWSTRLNANQVGKLINGYESASAVSL